MTLRKISFLRTVLLAVVLAGVFAPTSASAHGSTESNLDEQVLETAPERAEFVYSGDVERTSARASLRYLGEESLSAEDYFRFDVPTLALERAEPLTGTGPEFAFTLPRLAAGSYAIDWEVTPTGDHADSSVTFFQVTIGVTDPDPLPPVPVEESADIVAEEDAPTPALVDAAPNAETASTSSRGWDSSRWFGLLGALVLVVLLTAFFVYRDRDK